jgi:site-specific recombinase XerD
MKKQLDQVLSYQQMQTLVITPSNLYCSQRNDKLLETVLLMAYLGLRVSEAINFS